MHTDKPIDIRALADAVKLGNRNALATALNLLDDNRTTARGDAAKLLSTLNNSQTQPEGHLVGITGPPGVGKSSLTAALIRQWRARDKRVAVLAVDPSSPISGGALLGDRLRMQTSDEDDGVFIRSLSSRGEFGGISAEVWPMSLLMLVAFDIVVIETVGVGQREVDVASLCDTTCYIAQPGSGDSVQFLKAGILEVPHIIVVNKEDMGAVATRTLAELDAALGHEHADGNWQIPVLSASATMGTGIKALVDKFELHHQLLLSHGALAAHRRRYQSLWVARRLEQEFGRQGIRQLGGEQALLEQLELTDQNLYTQYETLRKQLDHNTTGSNS